MCCVLSVQFYLCFFGVSAKVFFAKEATMGINEGGMVCACGDEAMFGLKEAGFVRWLCKDCAGSRVVCGWSGGIQEQFGLCMPNEYAKAEYSTFPWVFSETR